jgi:hypothetical protein
MQTSRLVLVGAITALLAACGGSDGDSARTGTLKLGVTDAPVDVAAEVVVQFTGVELKPVGGQAFSIDFSHSIDLLEQQGAQRAMLLDGATVPAGEYEWMRLKVDAEPNVDDSYIAINAGERCELHVPSGAESGLKVIRGFTVGVGSVTDMTIDFNLRKSVVQPPGQEADADTCGGQAYLLKPVLRVVDNLQVGTITGNVDPNLVAAGTCPTSTATPGNVYLYGPYAPTDTVPSPEDLDDDAAVPDPITTASVDETANYAYTIGFVPPGNYVVAYTCDADDATQDADAAEATEVVTFEPAAGKTVTVTANAIATVNFP